MKDDYNNLVARLRNVCENMKESYAAMTICPLCGETYPEAWIVRNECPFCGGDVTEDLLVEMLGNYADKISLMVRSISYELFRNDGSDPLDGDETQMLGDIVTYVADRYNGNLNKGSDIMARRKLVGKYGKAFINIMKQRKEDAG